MRYLIYILILSSIAYSNIYLENIDISNYPEISADLYVYDNNAEPVAIDKEELFLFEFSSQEEIEIIECFNNQKEKRNLVIALDQSSSMLLEGNFIAELIIKELIAGLDKEFNEIAIIGFNTRNYLLKNFSSDEEDLLEVFDFFDARGSSDIDAALLNSPSGALQLAIDKDSCDIVIITDGTSTADFDQIRNLAGINNIKIHTLLLESERFDKMKKISKDLNSSFIGNVGTDIDPTQAAKFLRMKNSNSSYCMMKWESILCREDRFLSIAHTGTSSEFTTEFRVAQNKLPYLNIQPNVLDFGIVPEGDNSTKEIKITPVNGSILLEELINECEEFEILNSLPDTLRKDVEYSINIEFTPKNESFKLCQFTIKNTFCDDFTFFASGGPKDGSVENKGLKIIEPKRFAEYFPNEPLLINWTGILPNSPVKLEISSFETNNWELIEANTNNPPYEYNAPLDPGDYKIKVSQISQGDRFSNVNYIRSSPKILHFDWNHLSNKIAIANDHDEVEMWDPFTESSEGNIGSGFIGARLVEWASTIDRAAVFRDFGDDNKLILLSYSGDEIIELTGSPDTIAVASWSSDDEQIAGALMNGDVYIWNEPVTGSNKNFDHIISNVTLSQPMAMDWSNSNEIALGDFVGNVHFIDPVAEDVDLKRLYDGPITNLKWNNTGDTLFIFSQLHGFYLVKVNKNGNDLSAQTVLEIEVPGAVYADWHTERNKVFVAVDDEVQEWDPTSGEKIYTFKGHKSNVVEISCSDDFIASLGQNNEMLIWSEEDAPHEENVLQNDISAEWSVVPIELRLKNISFGDKCVGFSLDTLFPSSLVNRSEKELIIDSITVSDPSFTILNETPIRLNINEEVSLKIAYQPGDKGNVNVNLIWHINNEEFISKISANVIDPDIRLETPSYDFGKVNIGDISKNQINTLFNGNDFELNVSNVEILYGDLPFSYLSTKTFTMPANSEYTSEISFSPTIPGKFSGIVKYHAEINCTPLELSISGEAVYPEPVFEITNDLGTFTCSNEINTFIKIKNEGTGDLLIFDPTFSSSDFTSTFSDTFTLSPDQEFDLPVTISTNDGGKLNSELELSTNLLLDGSRSFSMQLECEINNSSFEISTNELVFIGMDKDEEAELEFEFLNSGTKEQIIELVYFDHFEISSAVPNPVPAGESSTITVKFKGGDPGVEYLQSHTFNDDCGHEKILELIARPGNPGPSLTALNLIKFPDQICDYETADTTIQLVNSGSSELLINEISLENGSNFSINDNAPISIDPGRSKAITINFDPDQIEAYTDKLILNTNINENNGVFEINLSGNYNASSLEFSDLDINFEDIPEQKDSTIYVQVTNKGSFTETFNLPIQVGNFIIESINVSELLPGSSATISVRFTGGELDTEYSEKIVLSDNCNNEYEFDLFARVRSSRFAVINIGTSSAKVGDTLFIPIALENPKDITFENNFNISTTLTFNSTLIYPLTEDPGIVIDGFRHLPLTLSNLNDLNGEKIQIPFLATLGNSIETEITSTGTVIIDDQDIWFVEKKGVFKLENVCIENGELRLVDGSDLLLIGDVYPNPANEVISLDLNLIEDGDLSFEIYNNRSHLIHKERISLESSYYQFNYSTQHLSIGQYIIVIRTRTQTFYRQFLITR